MKNKSQAAFEFVILAGIMMAVFVAFFAISSEKIADMNEARRDVVAQDIVDTVMAEIEIAEQSFDGYSRNFTMPEYIEGQPYEIRINVFGSTRIISVIYQGKLYNYEMPYDILPGTTAYKGQNRITKDKNGIFIANGDDPCNDVQIGADSYCIGGGCYCYPGHYPPAGVCRHEGDMELECGPDCEVLDACNPAPAIIPALTPEILYSPGAFQDTMAKLAFTTNESATAIVKYGPFEDGGCPAEGNMLVKEEKTLKKDFEITLNGLYAETGYCFQVEVSDKKKAKQVYSEELFPDNPTPFTFTTGYDVSPPSLVLLRMNPEPTDDFDYGQSIALNVNLTDNTSVDLSETWATIKQKNSDGTETEIETVTGFADVVDEGVCNPGYGNAGNDPDDDGYIACFDINSSFARYVNYDEDGGTLFYASYNNDFNADFAKGTAEPTEIPVTPLAEAITAGRFGNGLGMQPGDNLVYSLASNFNAEQGTIEFWFKPSDSTTGMLLNIPGSGNQGYFRIYKKIPLPGVVFEVNDISGNPFVAASGSLSVNNWHFVAVTWDNFGQPNSEMNLYIDGEEVANLMEDNIMFVPGNGMDVGSDGQSGYPSNSVIDQLRILDYKKEEGGILSDYSITKDYDIYLRTKDKGTPDDNAPVEYEPGEYPISSTSNAYFSVSYK